MLMVIMVEISPVEYWGALSGMVGFILATGSILGIYLITVSLARGRGLLCHYRTYPRWCHYRKGIVALDLFVQRSSRCCGNSRYAFLLASKGESIQEAQHHLAVDPASRLGGCHPTAGSFHPIGLCPPRRWEYSILMEQRNHYFHLDNLRSMLDRVFRLGIVAFFSHRPSTSCHFSFDHCAYQTSWASHNVC